MNVALFGGTFDPVHLGHLTAARAAMQSLGLDRIYFVPASIPPHKRNHPLTAFAHRYAMIALACAGSPQFIPSLLEHSEPNGQAVNYSIVTVRKMLALLAPSDRLYFLLGADAFLDISQWHQPVELLDSCDFIIVSRPGFLIAAIEKVIPAELHGRAENANTISLRRSRLHLLNTVTADVSSSAIRHLAAERKSLAGMVPDSVAEYIKKLQLFENEK